MSQYQPDELPPGEDRRVIVRNPWADPGYSSGNHDALTFNIGDSDETIGARPFDMQERGESVAFLVAPYTGRLTSIHRR